MNVLELKKSSRTGAEIHSFVCVCVCVCVFFFF